MIIHTQNTLISRPKYPSSFVMIGPVGILILFILLMVSSSRAAIAHHQYRTISTTSTRPMAMGGAFVSIRDNLAALNWNPASFVLFDREVPHRLIIYFNPIVPAARLYNDHRDIGDIIAALGTAVKAITYSHRWAELGLLLWEEPLYNPSAPGDGKLFQGEQILDHHSHSLGLRIRLAPTVSLGSSANLYNIQDENGHSSLAGGANYGVLLRPTRGLEVGLAYFDFPSSAATLRRELEGIEDESITGGISLHPDGSTILAMDLRNVSAGDKIGWDRFHFGAERTFWKRLALRFGYFQSGQGQHDVYTFGLGLVQKDGRNDSFLSIGPSRYVAHYSLLVEEGKEKQYYWHLLSVLVGI